MSAWRSSLTIVILRYLYFGLPDPEPVSHLSRSPTPTPAAQEAALSTTYDMSTEMLQSFNETMATYPNEEGMEGYFDPEYLAPEPYATDPISRSPSPMPSPRPIEEAITFDHWHRRHDIHNEAMSELFRGLSALAAYEDAPYLRYVLTPLMVMALVSSFGSNERTLCFELFERFKSFMEEYNPSASPIGGSKLDFVRVPRYEAEDVLQCARVTIQLCAWKHITR
jgi:hypothetical protein